MPPSSLPSPIDPADPFDDSRLGRLAFCKSRIRYYTLLQQSLEDGASTAETILLPPVDPLAQTARAGERIRTVVWDAKSRRYLHYVPAPQPVTFKDRLEEWLDRSRDPGAVLLIVVFLLLAGGLWIGGQ